MTDLQPADERNYMVLYALTVLPLLSICDEDTFDDLFTDLVMDIDSYESEDFSDHLDMLQDRYECLGITCAMIGRSLSADGDWPECVDPDVANVDIVGYKPTSVKTVEVSLYNHCFRRLACMFLALFLTLAFCCCALLLI